jgi:hypothetical protein
MRRGFLFEVWNGYNLRGQIGDGAVSSGWRVRIKYIVSTIFMPLLHTGQDAHLELCVCVCVCVFS